MKKVVFFVLVVGLVFIGCDTENINENDNGNGNTGEFVSSIDDTISNDIATLGLIGTSASSNNLNVATVEIATGKIKITSVSEGSAVITVSNESNHSATINISVSKTGSISIGGIKKYSENEVVPIIGIWEGIAFVETYASIEFREDGTGEFKLEETIINITQYELENEILKIKFSGVEDWIEFSYELSEDGNKLTIVGLIGNEEDKLPIVFTKK